MQSSTPASILSPSILVEHRPSVSPKDRPTYPGLRQPLISNHGALSQRAALSLRDPGCGPSSTHSHHRLLISNWCFEPVVSWHLGMSGMEVQEHHSTVVRKVLVWLECPILFLRITTPLDMIEDAISACDGSFYIVYVVLVVVLDFCRLP